MKTFEDICKMTQHEVKEYMKRYLASKKYDVVDQDGFLYAKGTVPVLLVAHMDTVHTEQCREIVNVNGKLSSPQGIGGDDRCGIFIIMNLVKELNCSVLLCEDEEKGGKGAHKFVKAVKEEGNDENGKPFSVKYIDNLDVNYMIEFDRKGSNDAVFYSCDNKDFINFVTDVTGFKYAQGSYSDISTLMPAAKLSAVNLSSGYYSAHTVYEYVMYDEMMDTVDVAKVLIKEKCDAPFKYVAKAYTPCTTTYANPVCSHGNKGYYYEGEYYGSLFDDYSDDRLALVARNDKELELEVIIYGKELSEEVLRSDGETKAECWMNLFLDNPNLCFNDIVDYSWG